MGSLFNQAGMAIYIALAVLCLGAARTATTYSGRARHVVGWFVCSGVFTLLALLRLFEVETFVEQAAKQFSRALSAYDDRALVQIPLVALTLLGMLVLVLFGIRAWRDRQTQRSERQLLLALFAVSGFVPLNALRLISWHDTDRLLYAGPVHLNWIVDIGLCALVAGAALIYIRDARRGQLSSENKRTDLRRDRAPRGRHRSAGRSDASSSNRRPPGGGHNHP